MEKIIKFTNEKKIFEKISQIYSKYDKIILDLGDLEINPQFINYMIKLYRYSVKNQFEIFFLSSKNIDNTLKKYLKIYKNYESYQNMKLFSNFEIKIYMNNEYLNTLLNDIFLNNGFTTKIRNESNFLNKEHHSRINNIYIVDFDRYKSEKLEEIKKIKKQNNDTSIILIVDEKNIESALETLNLGVDSIIKKPVNKDEVLKLVKRIAIQANLKDENNKLNEKIKNLYNNLEQELKLANSIQQSLLPKNNINIGGYKISYIFEPSQEIGGDFCDVINLDDKNIAIVFADISGHGIPAALLSSMLKVFIRSEINNYDSTNKFLEDLNEKVISIFPKGKFVSIFYILINTETNLVKYCKASQEAALLLDSNKVYELETEGQILGVFSKQIFKDLVNFEQKEFIFKDNNKILLYTDGITEAVNKKDLNLYGLDRLKNTLINTNANLDLIKKSLDEYNLEDDLTLLLITK